MSPNSSANAQPDHDHRANNSTTGETLRFLCVGLVGFLIDISIVWSLINFYAVAEGLACIAGFVVATATCFFAHKHWTFPHATEATLWRFLGYWSVTLFTLAVRLLLFTKLGELFTRDEVPIPVRLAIAGGVAFVLAYLLSNRLVFSTTTR